MLLMDFVIKRNCIYRIVEDYTYNASQFVLWTFYSAYGKLLRNMYITRVSHKTTQVDFFEHFGRRGPILIII